MYRVVSIDRDEMTKNIQIKNLETGTVDICFDDSSLVSDENFDFMREGNEYECKIKLFGTVGVQSIFDSVIPNLLPALFVGILYYIFKKKKVSIVVLILAIIAFAILMSLLGWL